ncbi:MAG: DNA polymerase III subunit epsilon [Chloroflexi bacterium]|nr:DNA polymerase III subunit epsilon [Chloroflexota bacterium]
MPRTYIALDLEFTGLDPLRDRIIEIGLVRFRGPEVLETFSSLVNPHQPIPYKIQQLSGITQAEVDKAPELASLTGQLLSFVKSYPLVGHTIEMDMQFLHQGGRLFNNLAIDTFELATILIPEAKRYSLATLAELLGIELKETHRALADAMATKDLFLALCERARSWDPALLEEVTRLSASSDWPVLHVLRDIVAEQRERQLHAIGDGRAAQPAPLSVRAGSSERTPRLEPTPTITPLDEDALAAFISRDGPFARSFPGYEYRPQQVEMLRGIVQAFNTRSHLLVEAGTGTGKSLAYLLPAVHFAVQNGRRVVISSNTINLQDQLFTKDIPDLQRCLPLSFRAALLKGRSNYLCMRRLANLRRSRQLTTEQSRVLAKAFAWLPHTQTGDRAELLLVGSDFEVWSDIQASSETCLGDRCPYRQNGECFFYRARAQAERAHLVIVNHALLLSDLVLESRILPEYKYVIIDEAHHLEDQATDHFGFQVGRQDVYAFLSGITHQSGDTPGGLLGGIPQVLQGPTVSQSAQQAVAAEIESLRGEADLAQRRLYELFNFLERFLAEQGEKQSQPQNYDQAIRLTSGIRAQPDWANVEIAWENLSAPLRQILSGLERLLGRVENSKLGEDSVRDELAQEVRAYLLRGHEIWVGMQKILMEPDPQTIYWFSIARRTQEITLHSAPLHVGSMLQDNLFGDKDCVILTSATLRTAGSFAFIKERLSLEDPIELALDSPFDFKTAVLLYVPKDIPEPNEPYYQKTVEQALIELFRATEGRGLVLFTSNSQLYATYHAIQRPLEHDEILLFGQGIDGSRRQILDHFRTTSRSVLLGTRSFWEGIDVVGQALSCLVITRLPFGVPTDPILAARAETFDDPFNEYYLPDAILRFRQGFGRLIRSQDDFGVVVVLDKRLLTKSYGKTFLRSLPGCTARQGPLASLPVVAQRWLNPANRA